MTGTRGTAVWGRLGAQLRPLRRDPAVARTIDMLAADRAALRRVINRNGVWSAATVARAYHDVYAAAGPWLGRAREQRAATDSGADRARWDAWIVRLTPPERTVAGTYEGVCGLAGQAEEMLTALLTALVPCRSVGSVAAEIEQRLVAGEFPAGHRIDRRALCRKLSVPGEYVALAFADLSAKGLVEVRASGSVVVTLQPSATGLTGCGRQHVSVRPAAGVTA
ncbi:GntR family transcriptional regulator [Streptomyces sp. NPDC091278]|uniref:GntR family transcriptional regulator n=1 Tax=Streptomyces sp. NPDC091278 TaxID=3155301 RepID=UPI00344F7952